MAKKTVTVVEVATPLVEQKKVISPVSVDFPNEGLNNLAMKINEIVEHINHGS